MICFHEKICFFAQIKPENVLMCVDEEHVRALAYQAAEWHKPGIKPVGSAGMNFE